jgi:futalosine hydrolase
MCALPAELRYFPKREGVEVLASGVGPVEAALTTVAALMRRPYSAVINAGIGGAFPGQGEVGDAVLVGSEMLAGLGLEGGGRLSLPDGAQLIDCAEADAALLARCAGSGLRTVRGVTVSTITTTDETAERLCSRYDAVVESMEGFAVLRAGTVAGVPALEVRGISNYVGDRAKSAWNFELGARATAAALEAVLDHLL